MAKISPLAPAAFPQLPPLDGTRIATAAAGINYAGRTDVLLMTFPAGTTAAGVFTRSKCPSAPVDWCRAVLPEGAPRALLVNSGNANAFTGRRGRDATRMSAELAAKAAGCRPEQVLLASTGVIGEPLEAERFAGVMERMAAEARPNGWREAASTIMTTDTFPKGATREVKVGEATVTLNGIAKGAGMIAPDMATMLAFLVTDAPIAAAVLQSLLAAGIRDSFNAITVDSDTSTSDTVLLLATGTAPGIDPIADAKDRRLGRFRRALNDLMRDLAIQVVRDGEGARKLVEIRITGAVSKISARRIGKAIGNSPLVKTAIAGEDANWGRVVMAIGKAGEPADRDRIAIWFGDVRVAANGERDRDYSEAVASDYMKRDHIVLSVDLGLGRGRDTVWTCDLTKDYVAINGDYRS